MLRMKYGEPAAVQFAEDVSKLLALAGWEVGLEFNIFGLVFGIDPLDPAIKLPMIGRIGPSLAGAPRQIDLKGK